MDTLIGHVEYCYTYNRRLLNTGIYVSDALNTVIHEIDALNTGIYIYTLNEYTYKTY